MPASRSEPARGVALYTALGSTLVHFRVNADQCTLEQGGAVNAPDSIQYGCPDGRGKNLYTVSSDGRPIVNGRPAIIGTSHHLTAFRINPADGALQPHGSAYPLASRPVHMTLDRSGEHALVAYHDPARATVHKLDADGKIGAELPQAKGLDAGIYPHQIRVAPRNGLAVIVARGNKPMFGRPEDPGSLKIFDFRDGLLSNRQTVAPGGGYGFGPRHIDFDSGQRWIFAALERQNKFQVFRIENETVGQEPAYTCETLIDPAAVADQQMVGTVHVHPNDRFVYVSNRANGTVSHGDRQVFAGGENSIAVFAIDQDTGRPTLIQQADTHGYHARTFAIDPSGRMLVAAHIRPVWVRGGSGLTLVPACLTTFRIGDDGKLHFANRYPVDTTAGSQFWMNMTQY